MKLEEYLTDYINEELDTEMITVEIIRDAIEAFESIENSLIVVVKNNKQT